MHCHYRVCPACKHHMDPTLLWGYYKVWVCHKCQYTLDRGLRAWIQRIRNRGY